MKNIKTKSLLFCLSLFICTTTNSQANRDANAAEDSAKDGYSELWGMNGENWTPQSRLPDFSFAGYDMGESEIPKFPVRARLGNNTYKPNDGKDDADELQRLIDTIQRPGVIIIPRGVWNIGKRIKINVSGVVLRGEEGAEFKFNKSLREIDGKPVGAKDYAFKDAFFIVEGVVGRESKKNIIENTHKGSRNLVIQDGVSYQAGDMIEINQTDPEDQSLFQFIHGTNQIRDLWYDFKAGCRTHRSLHKTNIFRFFARVVSQDGNRVTINRPLPLRIDTKWSPKINRINMDLEATTQNIGFENLTIRMNGDEFAGHFTPEGSSFLDARKLFNSWIRDIDIIDADNGINVRDMQFSLIEQIRYKADKRTQNNNGHHALWLRSSGDNLISHFEFQTKSLHDISVEFQARQNVFSRTSGKDMTLDHHRSSPFANLFTEIDVGKGTDAIIGGGAGCVGPHTARYTTFWNIVKNTDFGHFPHRTKHDGRLKQNAKDWNYAHSVGLKGSRLSPQSKSFGQFIEFSFGEQLQNPNLFIAQVNKRFSDNLAPNVVVTSPSNNQVFEVGDTIHVSAIASDHDGSIKRVRFNSNDEVLRYDNKAPYVESFTASAPGTYRILANARDNENKESEDVITIKVVAKPSTGNTIVHMTKANTPEFALDGGPGAANDQNVKLWSTQLGNQNQQWVEINRGGDSYSYQKRNTNFCIDAGNGGERRQNVKLWQCDEGNRNQHFRKISLGGGLFRLQKRNAPDYSIDAGPNGERRQNIKLWENRTSADSNQIWKFTVVD